MILALYILLALVAVGAVLYIFHRRNPGNSTVEPADKAFRDSTAAESEECCGMHITCEKDSLLAAISSKIEYYDDEELDVYRGTPADAYTPEATEQFRDVLLTLLPDDIAGWARSLQLRGIEMPTDVRDELLMIVAEARKAKTTAS